MTRKEQVTNKVKEIMHESGYNAIPSTLFEIATWADKTMIDKACEWLKLNAEDYVATCYDKGELDSEGLLMDFRKAMEE